MGRVVGRVRVGPVIGQVKPIERAKTEVTHLDDQHPAVFADPGGTRRRRLRKLAYVVGALLFALLLAFWLSQVAVGVAPR
ncbi:hypothetical protein [Paractinoplanes rishiriensis]|uniref:Uncharacterized protein n=1 Tax=Paractinoplanes rishiriensis TaxID=1050105 RepID=A0A919K9A3_9ACTN|nr:hypothetical protein [Actinoplanes rishiriensis]GIF01778.1 hypothetical protein Ari01nite_92420 [Actinoplanes rishiriensis]